MRNRIPTNLALLSILFFSCSQFKSNYIATEQIPQESDPSTTSDDPSWSQTPILNSPPVNDPVSPITSQPNFGSSFVSLHQLPILIANADFSSNLNQYIGFRSQFDPTGRAGCRMGNLSFSSQCNYVSRPINELNLFHNFSNGPADSSGHTYYSEMQFKFYIPKGSFKSFSVAYLPQWSRVATVTSLDRIPNRNAPLTIDEYSFDIGLSVKGSFIQSLSYQSRRCNTGAGFEDMLGGDEVVCIHSGGGQITLSPELRRSPSQALEKGHWVYVRVLNLEQILVRPLFSTDVKADLYQQWYSNQSFGVNGDPIN